MATKSKPSGAALGNPLRIALPNLGPSSPSCLAGPDSSERAFRYILRTAFMIRQVMEPFFAQHGLTVSTWVPLRMILHEEEATGKPIRLVDLSRKMMIQQPTLTAAINKLELLGYIERIASPENKRDRLARVTEKGRALVESMVASHRDRIQILLAVWTPEEKDEISQLFEKLAVSLEGHLQSAGAAEASRFVP